MPRLCCLVFGLHYIKLMKKKYIFIGLIVTGALIITLPFILFVSIAFIERITLDYEYNQRQKYGMTKEQCAEFTTSSSCEKNKGCDWMLSCLTANTCDKPATDFTKYTCIPDPTYTKL